MTQMKKKTAMNSQSNRKYQPRNKRFETPPRMKLQERDKQVMLGVYRFRFLNSEQIEALFFTTSTKPRGLKPACLRRLYLMYHNGYLDRVPLPVVMGEGRNTEVYALDELGAVEVGKILGTGRPSVQWQPKSNKVKPLFLDHSLSVSDMWVIVSSLDRDGQLEIVSSMTETELKSADMQDKIPYLMRGARIERKVPDAYFALRFAGKDATYHFTYEDDQGTETKEVWQSKIKAHLYFRTSGLSEKHYGTRNYRMLTKTVNEQRLHNLKKWTEEAGGARHFWFAIQDKLDIWQPTTFLDPIWQMATEEGLHGLV